jgi:hypothetical protein
MAAPVRATPLISSVQLVTAPAALAQPQPSAQTFTVAQAGSYTVTLTDLQIPSALGSLNLAIATPAATAITLTGAGSQTVSLAAGTYTAQILAQAAAGAPGGTFSAAVAPSAGGAAIWQYENSVGAANMSTSAGATAITSTFSVATGGSYQLAVTDLAFPVALSSLSVIILNDCGTTPGCVTAPVAPTPVTAANTGTALTLAAGNYDLFVIASADSTARQGLLSVQITGAGSTAPVYANTIPVGTLPPPTEVDVHAASTVEVDAVDLAVPSALSALQAVVVQQGAVLSTLSSPGTASFAAAAGALQVYALGTPGASGQGGAELVFTSGATRLADFVVPVFATGSNAFAFAPTLSAAGNYQLAVHDFQLPTAFVSLLAAAAQGGKLLTSTAGSGSFAAAGGPLNILVFPVQSSAPGAQGLFGVQVAHQSNGGVAFQTAQGVGASFSSSTFTVPKLGSYNLSLADLAFPAPFSTLAVIVTNGSSVVGEVFGSSTVAFTGQPGINYSLNTLASAGSSADYGLYGLQLGAAPAPPTVTLTASSSSVVSGSSATLNWTSTGTTACTASGAWSGTLATAGTQSVGPLTSNATYSISCSGSSSTSPVTASVAITVTPRPSTIVGGGGAWSALELLWLGIIALRVSAGRVRLINGR